MEVDQMPEASDSVSRALIDAQAVALGKLRARVEALERKMSTLCSTRATMEDKPTGGTGVYQ